MKQTVCSMIEDLVELSKEIKDDKLEDKIAEYLIKIQKAASAMEKRLRRYRKSIERLGFKRV